MMYSVIAFGFLSLICINCSSSASRLDFAAIVDFEISPVFAVRDPQSIWQESVLVPDLKALADARPITVHAV